MGASKQKSTQQSATTTTPYGRPDLQYGLGQNRDLYNTLQGRTYPDFSTVAAFSPTTNSALDAITARGLNGSPVTSAAQDTVSNISSYGAFGGSGVPTNAAAQFFLPTARGDYLDFSSNPLFDQGVDAISDEVGSMFERSGRTASGANQSSVARGIGDLVAGIYNQERDKQFAASQALAGLYEGDIANQFADASMRLNAAGQAPGLAATDFADLQAVLSAGQAIDAKNQQFIDEDVARYNFPYENAIAANQLLNSGLGGLAPLLGNTVNMSGSSTQTSSPGLLNSILGGIATGASIASGFNT